LETEKEGYYQVNILALYVPMFQNTGLSPNLRKKAGRERRCEVSELSSSSAAVSVSIIISSSSYFYYYQ
jgi:hypothetical protein